MTTVRVMLDRFCRRLGEKPRKDDDSGSGTIEVGCLRPPTGWRDDWNAREGSRVGFEGTKRELSLGNVGELVGEPGGEAR